MNQINKKPMTAETLTIIVIIGLAAGILGGMIGIGGGLVIVPALIYFLAYSQKEAQGTSLGLLLLPVGILGVLNYYRKGYVDLKVVGLLSIGFVIGSYLGSKWALSLPQATLKKVFAAFLLLLAIKMLLIDKK
jgi:uncharacterized membrane protein YfcA